MSCLGTTKSRSLLLTGICGRDDKIETENTSISNVALDNFFSMSSPLKNEQSSVSLMEQQSGELSKFFEVVRKKASNLFIFYSRSRQTTACFYKVLLAHDHTHLFTYFLFCFYVTKVKLTGCNRCYVLQA